MVRTRRLIITGVLMALCLSIAATTASAHVLSQSRATSAARVVAQQDGGQNFDSIRVACNRRLSAHSFRCIAEYMRDGQMACDSYIKVGYRNSSSYRLRAREYQFECY